MTNPALSVHTVAPARFPKAGASVARLLFVAGLAVLFVWPTIDLMLGDAAQTETSAVAVDQPEARLHDGRGKWTGY